MELNRRLVPMKQLVENSTLHPSFLVEDFLFAVDAANHVDVPVELQALGTQGRQVGELEQGLVVGGGAGVGSLQMERFLLPVLLEELLCSHWLNEALEQTVRTVEAQRRRGVALLNSDLFLWERLLMAAPPLC